MYNILENDVFKRDYDCFVSGPIFDESKKFVGNVFNKGERLHAKSFSVKWGRASIVGKLRDRLCVRVNAAVDVLVISGRAVSFLKSNGVDNIEVIPLHFIDSEIEIKDYYLINILDKIACADEEESEMSYFGKDIYTIDSLVLDETKIPASCSLFLLGQTYIPVFIFKNELVEAIHSSNLVGFRFVKPQDLIIQ